MDRIQQIQKSAEAALNVPLSRRGLLRGVIALGTATAVVAYDNGNVPVDVSVQSAPLETPFFSRLLNSLKDTLKPGSRIARASAPEAAGVESIRSSCADLSEVEDIFVQCLRPNDKNGKKGYQPEEGDRITGKHQAEFLVVNTANPKEFYNAKVNEHGELYHEVVDSKDGKVKQVRVFVFSGTPNAIAKNGRPAIRAEIREKKAYDKTFKKVVELGDPMYHDSAVNCTPLPVYLWKDESYKTPPAEAPELTPARSETPPAPRQIPPVQIPILPRSGGGSDEAPNIDTRERFTPWPGQEGR
jgi:hypothetical protein